MSDKGMDAGLGLLRRRGFWLACALGLVCVWTFWPTLVLTATSWYANPEYSHGFLVPIFAGYLLYRRRDLLPPEGGSGSWIGLPVLLLGAALRLAGASTSFDYLDAVSLIPCLLGLALLLGGWPAFRWSWPAILFLLFMIPLPFRVAHGLSGPLRGIATRVGGYTLETLGLPVIVEGYTILLDEHHIAVAEACSGLSMLYVFVALSTAVAIVIQRPWIDRLLVLLAAAPIAVVANVVRITVTAYVYWLAGPKWGEFIFHDLAGWLMMPLALFLLWLELKLIDVILVPADATVGQDGPTVLPGLPGADSRFGRQEAALPGGGPALRR